MIWSFLTKHWRPILGLVLVVAAFMVGRYTTPGPDIVTATQIKFVERKVEVVKVVKAKDRIVYRDVTVKPDGTRIDHSVERSVTETKAAKTTDSATDSASDSKTAVSTYKPQWRVGALIGLNVGGIHFDQPMGWGLLSAGAFAERRLVGPFWFGLWGMSTGPSFGLMLAGEF